MAENIMNANQRSKLPSRHEPYWRKLAHGKIGYRTTGSWLAQWTTSEMQDNGMRRKTIQKFLSTIEALPDYKDAEALANAWFDECRGGVVHVGTVEEACKDYVKNQRITKGDNPANFSEMRFAQTVNDTAFGRMKLGTLTTRDIIQWRNSLVTTERKKNSANRILRSLKAALTFGFKQGMCPSDLAWRRVEQFKGSEAADGKRAAHLTQPQRKALLAECSPDLANFVRALLYTAARPNEIQGAVRSDFDAKQGTLRLDSLKGSGTTRERHVPLSKSAVEFFKAMTKDKLTSAPLVTMNGEAWVNYVWAHELNTAIDAANEKLSGDDRLPEDTVAYTMRHCAITDMLSAGINVAAVAKIAGTSIGMIEKYYFKFIATDVSDKLAAIQAF
jgi:integrase